MTKTSVLTLGLALIIVAAASAPGCMAPQSNLGSGGPDDPNNRDPRAIGNDPPAPPDPMAPPKVAVYKRGSLSPIYQLLSRNEYGRIAEAGTPFSDNDYAASNVAQSSAAKLDQIGANIAQERGLSAPVDFIPDIADRQRAQTIPFRGNPSDVKYLKINGKGKAYIPLGGDITTPGNEVAIVNTDGGNYGLAARVVVGLRPQRIAVHPAGLVFVCNQYSNYISIIDPQTDDILQAGGKPVEIKTEYYCADLAFVPKDPLNPDRAVLYVANRWRHSVLQYQVDVVRDPISDRAVDIKPVDAPLTETLGVGANPNRLAVSDQQNIVFVANNKGGEVSKIEVATNKVTRMTINGASTDVVSIQDLVFVPTTTIDRGLLAQGQTVPNQVNAGPVVVKGLDGADHVAHPGALFDNTRSYNFEDLRNGMMQLDLNLQRSTATYYTDDVSSEPNFQAGQKILAGAVPTTILRNKAGTRVYVAEGASDIVQELTVDSGSRPFVLRPRRTFKLAHRPFGLAMDEENQRLFVADWASEIMEVVDLQSGQRVAQVDLGYAQPEYPATTVERGERFFYEASWSNNGRKSCATCHVDELDTDGVGFANGATAPTSYHQVKPNHNLANTNSYFWNGSFGNGNYTSLAFAAQTRGNCQLIEFGFIDGPASDPRTRVGDRNNFFRSNDDSKCRPVSAGPSQIRNQDDVTRIDAAEKKLADDHFVRVTGLSRQDLARAIDAYSVAEPRLPPNPLKYLNGAAQIDPAITADIAKGKELFVSAGCSGCHTATDTRHPFTDGLNHGSGADWTKRFVNTYANDPRITQAIGSFAQTMLEGITSSVADHEVNMHVAPIDYFVPFCFDVSNCVQFDDPLQVRGSQDEESRRIDLLVQFNLGDPDRTFIPGNVFGQVAINTPSLRGVWTQANLLHHGLAHTVAEAILAPGHPALGPGETGFAADALQTENAHGATKNLSKEDVRALVRYVEGIE